MEKIEELKNVRRIVQNNLNLIAEVTIQGSHAFAVAEIVQWLSGFDKRLSADIDLLTSSLPQQGKEQETVVVDSKPI